MQHELWLFRVAGDVKRYWGIISTLAGLALAVAALKGTYIDPKFPDPVYQVLLWAGMGSIFLLALCAFADHAGWWLEGERSERFRPAKRTELDEILPLYDRVVGGIRPSLNELKNLYSANSQIFTVLEKRSKIAGRTSTKIVGFCTIIPLNKEAKNLLEREELHGLKMSPEHICSPRQKAACLYIGSIGAEGYRAKGAVLGYTLGVLNECAQKGVAVAFTRPVTLDGLRVARQHDFEPVSNNVRNGELERLYRLNLAS